MKKGNNISNVFIFYFFDYDDQSGVGNKNHNL